MTRSAPVVLYIVSRFPAVTETFVVNEWLALSERFRMQLVALRRTREGSVHPETRRVMPSVRFAGVLRPATVAAHLSWLVRRPRTYLSVLAAVVRGGLRFSPLEAAKETVVFLQAGALARVAVRDGVDHVHAHFASHPATAAWIVHRLTGIPFSFTAHANDLFVAPVLLDRKAADARFVIAISEYNRRVLRERCSRRRGVSRWCIAAWTPTATPGGIRVPGTPTGSCAWRASSPRRATCTSSTRSRWWPSAGPASGSSSWATGPSATGSWSVRASAAWPRACPCWERGPPMTCGRCWPGPESSCCPRCGWRAGGWRASRWP